MVYGSTSKFMLSTVLSDKKVIIDPYTFLKGMDELTLSINRVGNNVNQIAKHLHATKEGDCRFWSDTGNTAFIFGV
jgi:hypothetical protein